MGRKYQEKIIIGLHKMRAISGPTEEILVLAHQQGLGTMGLVT